MTKPRTRQFGAGVVWWSGRPDEWPDAALLKPVKDGVDRSTILKPEDGGLWTSPDGSDASWEQWCEDNEYGGTAGSRYLLTPDSPRTVFVIEGWPDLVRLQAAFPSYPKHRLPSSLTEQFPGMGKTFSWEDMAKQADGVWLTAEGFYRTRLPMLRDTPPGWEGSLGTNGWDCETVLWFRWVFSEVEQTHDTRGSGADGSGLSVPDREFA